MKYRNSIIMPKHLTLVLLLLSGLALLPAQVNNSASSAIKTMILHTGNSFDSPYYTIKYRDTKPEDVPQEVYDTLFEIQKEVVDNFTYDYTAMRDYKKSPYWGISPTKEEYYQYGKGVCDDYSNFFILLAKEKGLIENLYKVSGKGLGGHTWLEYRTAENVYIIDPTWSDDYYLSGAQTKQKYRDSPAYGKDAFFITYAEDKIIFARQGYNHSSFTVKTAIPLWNVPNDNKE